MRIWARLLFTIYAFQKNVHIFQKPKIEIFTLPLEFRHPTFSKEHTVIKTFIIKRHVTFWSKYVYVCFCTTNTVRVFFVRCKHMFNFFLINAYCIFWFLFFFPPYLRSIKLKLNYSIAVGIHLLAADIIFRQTTVDVHEKPIDKGKTKTSCNRVKQLLSITTFGIWKLLINYSQLYRSRVIPIRNAFCRRKSTETTSYGFHEEDVYDRVKILFLTLTDDDRHGRRSNIFTKLVFFRRYKHVTSS